MDGELPLYDHKIIEQFYSMHVHTSQNAQNVDEELPQNEHVH